jgi:hypothetical protein
VLKWSAFAGVCSRQSEPCGARQSGKKRQEAIKRQHDFWANIERQNKIRDMMKQYDVSKTGGLDRQV